MELLLIWAVFGIVCALVASNKDRSVFGWFIMGVMFGPFGLLFILLSPNLKNVSKVEKKEEDMTVETNAGTIRTDGLKECIDCAEEIKVKAKKCRHCGYQYSEEEMNEILEGEKELLKQRILKYQVCSQCHGENIRNIYSNKYGKNVHWCYDCKESCEVLLKEQTSSAANDL
jgi:ribosomal protein L40E